MAHELAIAIATGTGLALASSGHCALMCGPIAAASHATGGRWASYLYLTGRAVSYTLLGAVAGSVGRVLLSSSWARWAEALLSWLLAALLLRSALGFLGILRSERLVHLRTHRRPTFTGRVLSAVAHDPLVLGALTALLPCGALFSALTASAALGSATEGALAMTTFSLLTAVVLGFVAQLSRLSSLGKHGRKIFAVALLSGAVLMVLRPLPALRHGTQAPCHGSVSRAATADRVLALSEGL